MLSNSAIAAMKAPAPEVKAPEADVSIKIEPVTTLVPPVAPAEADVPIKIEPATTLVPPVTPAAANIQIKIEPASSLKRKADDTQANTQPKRRKKRSKKIINIRDLDLTKDVRFLPVQAHDGFKTIKIYNAHTGKPLLVRFSGEGYLSSLFAVSESQYGGYTLTFNLGDDQDYEACTRLHEQLTTMAVQERGSWFDGSLQSDDFIQASAHATVTAPKTKNDKTFRPSFKTPVKLEHAIPNMRGVRYTNITDINGANVDDISTGLHGRKWLKTVVEFKGIYFGKENSYGFSKAIRAMKVMPRPQEDEIDADDSSDEEAEE